MTEHEANNNAIWVSSKTWNSLSDQEKAWVQGAADEIGTGAAWDAGELFVVEADESDGTFLVLGPRAGIVALVGALSVGALTACALIGPTVTSSTTTNYDPIEFSSAARTCSSCTTCRAGSPAAMSMAATGKRSPPTP